MSDLEIPPLSLPPSSRRIGIVGAGGIVRDAHLPAYRKAGWQVVAIADLRRDAAQELATRHGIARVFEDATELVRHPDVDVVDLAIPEQGRPPVLQAILEARKPVLVQKPLAYSVADARRIVEQFEAAGVPLAVNQNARWAPELRATRTLIQRGVLGTVFDVRWTMRNCSDHRAWARDSWYARDARFQVLSWSIHHLDLFRFWLDEEPVSVYCQLPRRPGQNFVGDILASAILRFPSGAQATMIDSNAAVPGRPIIQEYDVDGTEGSICGRVSEPRSFEVWRLCDRRSEQEDPPAHRPALEGVWYPDGFAGAMGDFLVALEAGREPSVSGRRNLGTVELVEACYRSAAENRVVELEAASS